MQIYAEPEFVRDLSRLNASEKSAIEECLYKLKNRQWDGGLRVKRLKGFPKRVWEARVNRDDRLLFLIDSATHEISGAEGALYVLDVVDHDHVSRVRRRNLAASSWLSLVLEHAKLPRNLVEELIDCTNEQLEGLALDEVRSSGEVTEHLREYAQRFVAPADYIETLSDVDRDIWLTEEQMDVVTTAGHCIVSGTAGSGKTTMAVQRLLADIESPHRKLYLAYNPWLVDYARELFQKLLPTKDKTLLGDSVHFSTVQQIMRDHLGATSGQFSDDAQVRFADFQLPCQSWNRHIAPATAWSEIRSIIKGACLDPGRDLLDLKDYRELGRNRSADLHQDREILHKIAQQYQKWLKEKKHYDEIDLCRQAIRHITSQHPAGYGTIVCDEVQDLTELQLELVFLLHTKPGALFFTGDLNQIINPSGFRWEEVNSHFYRRKQQKPERHHLSYNFRSGGGIVKLADAVLRLRARLAGGGAEQPQDNHLREGQKPRVIDGEETSLKAVLMSMAGRYVVLVRTEAQSKRLKVSLGTPLVHTIDEAKGLEFDQALVWDFFQDHQSLWRKALSGSLSAKDIPAIRHELNLLYVAITRPRRGLFLYDPHLTICLEDELDNVIDYAVPEALAEGSQGGLTAEEWGQQGKYYLDREFFEQAMFCFEQAEDMTSVRRIRARLLEQKKKWAEAAEEYLALQDYAVAARLFEKAGAWAKAAEEYLVLQNYAAAARLFEKARAWRKASRFYHEANSTQDYLRCDAQAAEAENQWADASRIWNSLGQTPRALQAIKKTNDPSLIKPLEAEALASEGKYARAAALYEQLSNWDLAIQNWEKSEHWQEAADVYLKAERYAEADEYALKLSSSLDRAKFRIRILIAQNNLNAARHLAQSEMPLDEAVKFFQQAGLSTEARYFKAYLTPCASLFECSESV
jgi:DNA helicase-2/ATP-dependent DNA helicase PcrA